MATYDETWRLDNSRPLTHQEFVEFLLHAYVYAEQPSDREAARRYLHDQQIPDAEINSRKPQPQYVQRPLPRSGFMR